MDDICKAAQEAQNSWIYGKSDHWEPIHLDEGTKLYQLDFMNEEGEISEGNFFFDEETYNRYYDPETNSFDVKSFCDASQIAPYFDGSYKNHISEYEVGEGGVDAAYGICENNPALGSGGASQIFTDEEGCGKLHANENFVSPQISVEERTIGKEAASDMISASITENLHAEGLQTYDEYLSNLANEADEIAKATYTEQDAETLNNIANEANLPETNQSQNQGIEQTQEQDTSIMR